MKNCSPLLYHIATCIRMPGSCFQDVKYFQGIKRSKDIANKHVIKNDLLKICILKQTRTLRPTYRQLVNSNPIWNTKINITQHCLEQENSLQPISYFKKQQNCTVPRISGSRVINTPTPGSQFQLWIYTLQHCLYHVSHVVRF